MNKVKKSKLDKTYVTLVSEDGSVSLKEIEAKLNKALGNTLSEAAGDLMAFGSCAVEVSTENGEVKAVCLKPGA